jgi:hypothetical protein
MPKKGKKHGARAPPLLKENQTQQWWGVKLLHLFAPTKKR